MMDPRRLLDGDASELELRLLSLAQREQAPSDAPRRLAAQLGLPVGLLGLDVVAQSADAAGSASIFPAASAGLGASAGGLLQGALGKLLLVGLVGSLGGATWWLGSSDGVDTSRSMGSSTAPGMSTSTGRSATTTTTTTTTTDTTTTVAAAGSALGQEVEVLDRVRGAVRAGDARTALRLLGELERAQPSLVLAQEAAALRIEALFAAGERRAGRVRAEQFLAAHPHSPHAVRVEALMRAGGSPR